MVAGFPRLRAWARGAAFAAVLGTASAAAWSAATRASPAHAGRLPRGYALLADEAERTHPSVRSLRASALAQRARIDRAGALPDPMVMAEWSMIPLRYPVSLSHTEMSGVELSIQQEIPFPGKRGLARDWERWGVDIAAARADEARRVVRATIIQQYYELAFLDAALGLLERNGLVLHSLGEHAKAQIAVGRSFATDLLRARTEDALLRERRQTLETRRAGMRARLCVLVGREGGCSLPATEPLGPAPALPPVDELIRRAEVTRPSLRQREAEWRRAKTAVRRAERDRYPNFIIGAAYRFRVGPHHDAVHGSDFYSLRFGLTLPVWGRPAAEAREAHARALEAQAEIDGERRTIRAELHRLHAEFSRERGALRVYTNEVRPLAEAMLRAAIPTYVAGRTDFHTMLQTWSRTLESELESLRALATLHAKAAEIEAAVGAPLTVDPAPGPTNRGEK
jgi:outer membrane protein TolC